MNYQQPELNSAFSDMVTREHRDRATPEDIAYLKEHMQEWRAELVNRLERTKGHIVNLQNDLAEDVFQEKRFELERKIAGARKYTLVIQATLSRVRTYKQEAKTKPHNLVLQQKSSYCLGYKHAIHTFHELIEGGLTLEQAHRACLDFQEQELTKWKHDTETSYLTGNISLKDVPSLVSREWSFRNQNESETTKDIDS